MLSQSGKRVDQLVVDIQHDRHCTAADSGYDICNADYAAVYHTPYDLNVFFYRYHRNAPFEDNRRKAPPKSVLVPHYAVFIIAAVIWAAIRRA